MKRYALIGKRLGHSYSQRWFEGLFARLGLMDHTYTLQEMASLDGLREWVRREGICGFNVTVPYKQEVLRYLDAVDETAAAIGAVNCVTVEGGRLVGHNTDAPAFRQSLENTGWQVKQAFILGTGGAARAVAYALKQMGIPFMFVSRNPVGENQIGYYQLSTFNLQLSTLLVNATPVGMYPNVDAMPLPEFQFSIFNFQFLFDLIYNPSPTRLMHEVATHGAQTKDGLEMLHLQAEMNWELFQQC
ncbi:MAG: shikimate dehydrogenase [Bacteroidales bacterium]|nr:shikimate dehydrogenase [Bacteroidales bacterium]